MRGDDRRTARPACLGGSEYLLQTDQTGKLWQIPQKFTLESDDFPINTGVGFLSRLMMLQYMVFLRFPGFSSQKQRKSWEFSMAMASQNGSIDLPPGDYTPRSPGPPREFRSMALTPRHVVGGRRWRLPLSTFPRYVSGSNSI